MTLPCGATRLPLRAIGWLCNGSRLRVVLTEQGPLVVEGVPAVIRNDLLGAVDNAWFGLIADYGTAPFDGGDHVHVTVEPRR